MPARAPEPLLRALGVKGRDVRLLVVLGGAYFLLNTGVSLGWLALTGRFFSRVGMSGLPLIYVILNLFTSGLFLTVAFSGRRTSRGGPLMTYVALWCVGLALFASFDEIGERTAGIWIGYLAAWLYSILVEQEFWVWVSSTLPVRLAKRLTPGLGALGTTGKLLGTFLVADPFGFDSIGVLLWLAVALSVPVLPMLVQAGRRARDHMDAQGPAAADEGEGAPEPEAAGFLETVAYVRGSGLMRRVLVISVALGVILGSAEYPLAATASARFPDEEDLAAFFGAFGAVNNLVAVLLQFLGTSYLIRRLPLSATLGALPGAMALVGLAGLLQPTFLASAAARFVQRAGVRVVQTPACNTLFNPVPARFLVGARAVAHSVAISFGFILSGVALRVIQLQDLGLEWAFGLLGASGLLALLAARGADQGYLQALVEATRGGRREDRMAALTVAIAYSGGSAEAPVLLATRDPALEHALVEAVARSQGEEFTRHLAEAIEEAGPEVAHHAAEALTRSHLPGDLARRLLTGLLARPQREHRVAALRLAASLEDPKLAPVLRGLLTEPGPLEDPDLPRVAEALLRVGRDPEDLRLGVRVLRRALAAPEPTRRAAGIRALGRLGMPAFVDQLGAALRDPADEVGEAAARALERTGTRSAAEALEAARDDAQAASRRAAIEEALGRLRDPHRHQVARRLASFRDRERKRLARAMQLDAGGKTLPLVAKALEIEWAPARAAVVRTLQEVEEEDFHAAVDEALGEGAEAREPDPVPLLAFCARRHPGPGHPARDLLRRLYRPSHRSSVVAFCAAELGDTDFRRDDREEVRARLELISAMVGIMAGDPEGFRDAFAAALGEDARKASAAIELIEAGAQAPTLKRRLAKGLELLRERLA